MKASTWMRRRLEHPKMFGEGSIASCAHGPPMTDETREDREDEDVMGAMMKQMFGGMTPEEKREVLGRMMDAFFAGMTPEERRSLMMEMMPRMMAGMMRDGGPEREGGSPPDDMLAAMRDCCARMGFSSGHEEPSVRDAKPA